MEKTSIIDELKKWLGAGDEADSANDMIMKDLRERLAVTTDPEERKAIEENIARLEKFNVIKDEPADTPENILGGK